MNLLSAFTAKVAKSAPNFGGGSGSYNYPLGAQYSDAYRKDRMPTPTELIRQLVGFAYGCVWLNSNAVASTHLRLFSRTKKGQRRVRFWNTEPVTQKTLKRLAATKETAGHVGQGSTIEEVKDHPILQLLDIGDQSPSVDNSDYTDTRPVLSGYNLLKTTQIYLESIGRAYWLVEFDGLSVPSKVWMLRSHMVREVFAPDGSGRILFYEYGGPSGIQYDPAQIVRFADPDPYNPYTGGMAPLIAAIEKLGIYRKQDANINAILENAARPDALFVPNGTDGGTIGAAEARRTEVALNQKFREAGKGSILVSPYPGSLEVLGWKPGDIVEIERAKMLKSEIGFIFGVPDSLIERNPANQAGAKLADYAHAKYCIQPRLRSISSTLRVLLRMFDPDGRLFFAFDDVMPHDEVFALEQTKAGADIGVVEVDELRTALDLEPYGTEAGKLRYIEKGMVAIDRDGNSAGNVPDDSTDDEADEPPTDDAKKSLRATLIDAGYADDEAARMIVRHTGESHSHAEL